MFTSFFVVTFLADSKTFLFPQNLGAVSGAHRLLFSG